MNETLMAYLLGPVVMAIVGVVLWIVAHYHGKPGHGRGARWLDTHYVDLMHHRH
ncbi:hypothetical protein [Paraburkholderia diazotrophica]|uniref:Uncharacterized protein n=1 Tax=Paraburkholderia diazotrophica TaxID=667676 RepID=A0A1H6Q225_9BURK|nr:hypothetical protein [Paraburkholderia diazotrophica]SEI37899.1 hypothetical protein SAMN05192539_100145 [Paraburkholderia diazotrophica]